MQRILTLDPGVTTGYIISVIDGSHIYLVPGQKRWNELDLHNFLAGWNVDHIICEDFEFRQRSKDNLELFSRNLIGIVNLHVQLRGSLAKSYSNVNVPRLFIQKPATGEGGHFKGDRALKERNIWKPGEDYHHSMSALRHFMYWLHYGYGYQYISDALLLTYTYDTEDSIRRYFT